MGGGGGGGGYFLFCSIKMNVINSHKFVLGTEIFSALLSKIVGPPIKDVTLSDAK